MPLRLTAVENLLKKFKALDRDNLMQYALSYGSIQADIVELNTIDQLYEKGVDARGVSLGEYSPATIHGTKNFKGKIEKGQPYDHITYKDSGEFYSTFRFNNEPHTWFLSANMDVHGENTALSKAGNIVGLTKENMQTMRGWVKAPFVNEMRKKVWTR